MIDKGTRAARIGRGSGEMIGGFAAMLVGGTGTVGGGAASGTGVGVLVGAPVFVGSVVLATGGAANVAVGGRGLMAALMSKGSGGKPPNMSPKDAARAGAFKSKTSQRNPNESTAFGGAAEHGPARQSTAWPGL